MEIPPISDSLGVQPQNGPSSAGVPEMAEAKGIPFNGWCAPDVLQTQLTLDLVRRVNAPKGAVFEQHLLYTDSTSALDWISFCNRKDYGSMVNYYDIQHMDWAATIVCRYLLDSQFERQNLDLVFLSCRDGKQEEAFTHCLMAKQRFQRLNCYLLDSSSVLALTSCQRFFEVFCYYPEVKPFFLIADFMNLPQYEDLFDEPTNKRLRVFTLFGGTIGNLSNELRLVRHSLRALKTGDLFLVHAYLGFASPDKQDEIRDQEPLFQHLSAGGDPAIEAWIRGPFERHRRDMKSIRFEYILKRNTTSTFPNSYTIEMQALVNEEARFVVLEMHRYELSSFIGTFVQEGFRIVSGQTYGYKNKRLVYLFAKE